MNLGRKAMTDDIVTRLRETVTKQIGTWDTLTEAADEIERLRAERDKLWQLINSIDRIIHKSEPINPWMHDRLVEQQTKQWPTLWTAIRKACTEYTEGMYERN